MTELKPCPFCGGKALLSHDHEGQFVRDLQHTKVPCKDCQFREPGCHGKCEIYRDWREELTAVRQRERLEKPESMEWQLYHKGR